MIYGPVLQLGDCCADMARPIYPTASTWIVSGPALYHCSWEGLTVSTYDKWNEEPCSRAKKVECMHEGDDREKDDEEDCCPHGGVVLIGFPAGE